MTAYVLPGYALLGYVLLGTGAYVLLGTEVRS